MIETDGVDGKALSLDDYIKQRKMGDQFSLSNQRKRVANLSEKALNKDLDSMIAYRVMNLHEPIKSSSCNKFNRGSLKDDSGDESDDDTPQVRMATIDSDDDVVMGDAEKSNLHEDLRDLPRFETVETIQGLRVRSQQWRMLPENLMDRPEGVPRLEVLPLPENERYRFKHNKIQKKNKLSRLSSVSSSNSKASKINVTSGTFVEKGGFTYKIGNRNRNGSQEGIIGIERSKRAPDLLPPQPPAAASAPSININLNYNSVPHLQNENNVELDNHAGPSAHVMYEPKDHKKFWGLATWMKQYNTALYHHITLV